MKLSFAVAPLALAACTAPVARPVPVATISPPIRPTGLERVLGQSAGGLTALFGKPDLDTRDEGARRLQFRGPICILDTYLYAPAGKSEAVVSYVDARQPDGRDIDRASCVAALVRRDQAR